MLASMVASQKCQHDPFWTTDFAPQQKGRRHILQDQAAGPSDQEPDTRPLPHDMMEILSLADQLSHAAPAEAMPDFTQIMTSAFPHDARPCPLSLLSVPSVLPRSARASAIRTVGCALIAPHHHIVRCGAQRRGGRTRIDSLPVHG